MIQRLLDRIFQGHVKEADAILDKAIAEGKEDVAFLSGEAPGVGRRWLGENNPGWWTRYTK